MNLIKALLSLTVVLRQASGSDFEISPLSPDPVRVFQGSDAIFQWTLGENITSHPDFKSLVFGVWRDGYVAIYITSVTPNGQIIPNPHLKDEAPQFYGRVQWRGDLSKYRVVFQISDVSSEDQMDFGLRLDFGPFRNSLTDSLRLEVEEMPSLITALPSLPIRTRQGKNVTFHCEFHLVRQAESLYEGVTVGVWESGGISLTLMTITKENTVVINPRLEQEGPKYNRRVDGHLSTNSTNNKSRVSVELVDVKESDERSYGCSMDLGPFREPIGSFVSIDVEGSNNNNDMSFDKNHIHESREVRVGKDVSLPCPVISEVIQLDGTFKSLYWSYCISEACTTIDTKWSWIAGMNSQRVIQVTQNEPYGGRVNLTLNGSLLLSDVRTSDGTDFRCTVQRVNFTSPRIYFVTLIVNATAPPTIKKRSKSEVTVVEGNALFLVCEAEGFPPPKITWRKNGHLLPKSLNRTKFIIQDARQDDAGNYKCEASNSAGTASYTCTVEITSKGKCDKTLTKVEIALLALVAILIVLVLGACCFCKRRYKRDQDPHYEKV